VVPQAVAFFLGYGEDEDDDEDYEYDEDDDEDDEDDSGSDVCMFGICTSFWFWLLRAWAGFR
jgi:hypothetical protein